MKLGMEHFAVYSRIANHVETVNGGNIRNREDVIDAIVELNCADSHFTDLELDVLADDYFKMQRMIRV